MSSLIILRSKNTKDKRSQITGNRTNRKSFIRYPGGKQRILSFLTQYLPPGKSIEGKFVEPFVGGGAVFFALNPRNSILADINLELIDLYKGLRDFPENVWRTFRDLPSNKTGYLKVRKLVASKLKPASRAARLLYLNHTCFKGMWRHNSDGQFNVGYGGQARRWVICRKTLMEVSKRLKKASIKCSSFERTIADCKKGDFIFLDPPYRPGEIEMEPNHYSFCKFKYEDHEKLASSLNRANTKGIKWAMTTTAHPKVLKLFKKSRIVQLPLGTGDKPGMLTRNSKEVLVLNY